LEYPLRRAGGLDVATIPRIRGRDGFDVDLALTVQVALFMALLLRSDGFRLRKWTLLVGLVAGCALLTKGPSAFGRGFVLAGALSLATALRRPGDRRRVTVNVGHSDGALRARGGDCGDTSGTLSLRFIPSAAGLPE
jgi:hypothetical protein